MRSFPPLSLAFTVWGLGAALYLVGLFHRVAPAVLTRELATEYELTAAALGNMIGAMVMQPAVGWVLDRAWDGSLEAGLRVYSFPAYRLGFALMLAWLVAVVMVTAFTRETHCRQQQ